MHILKHQEIERAKNNSKGKGKNRKDDKGSAASSQTSVNPNSLRHQAVDWLNGVYSKQYLNKMMMDAFGSGRFYHLNPELHLKQVVEDTEKREFPTSIYVKFKEGFIEKLEAGEVSKMFEQFGDFYLFKDTHNSVFIEFFFLDPQTVPDRKPQTLVDLLLQDGQMQIEEALPYVQAPKFKAHENFDAK